MNKHRKKLRQQKARFSELRVRTALIRAKDERTKIGADAKRQSSKFKTHDH